MHWERSIVSETLLIFNDRPLADDAIGMSTHFISIRTTRLLQSRRRTQSQTQLTIPKVIKMHVTWDPI